MQVHVWFPINQALAFVEQGVMAFHITGPQNRFTGCYIDGSRAVFEGSGLTNNVWTGGFECCAGSGLGNVPHGIEIVGNNVGPGLQIYGNIFEGGAVYSTPTSNASDVAVSGTRIDSNSFSNSFLGDGGAGTRVSLTLSQNNASEWSFNFCPQLVFPTIQRVDVSIVAEAGFPVAVARPPVGCTVLVESNVPFTGSITASVDSSALTPHFV